MRTILFHVPHDGTVFPEDLMESVCVSRKAFFRYHGEMRDAGAWECVPEEYRDPDHAVRFPVSRLLCDVERFIGPEEIMEKYGMGFCYERAYDGTKIRRTGPEEKERTDLYYLDHHDKMDRLCARYGKVLLLDMHSYSEKIIPEDRRRGMGDTPDICLGTDPRFTPEKLAGLAEALFMEGGRTVRRNEPYSGCFVPDAVWRGKSGCDLIAVMLEFSRRVCCGPDGSADPGKTEKLRETVRRLARAGALL